MGPKTERMTILHAATHETQLGDHDFCLSRSHYTDTDLTSRERTATAGIKPGTPHQESRALPTELPRPSITLVLSIYLHLCHNCCDVTCFLNSNRQRYINAITKLVTSLGPIPWCKNKHQRVESIKESRQRCC